MSPLQQLVFIGGGIPLTFLLWSMSLLVGFVLGSSFSVLIYYKKGVRILRIWISILRGTPVLLQISFIHFVLVPALGIKSNEILTGMLTLGLNSAAYMAEILRGGLISLGKGPFEVSYTLEIPAFSMWKDILFPQVLRRVLPTLTNESITLLKETALISVIGGVDIMRKADMMTSEHFLYFTPLCIAGLYYYLWTWLIATTGRYLERRLCIM